MVPIQPSGNQEGQSTSPAYLNALATISAGQDGAVPVPRFSIIEMALAAAGHSPLKSAAASPRQKVSREHGNSTIMEPSDISKDAQDSTGPAEHLADDPQSPTTISPRRFDITVRRGDSQEDGDDSLQLRDRAGAASRMLAELKERRLSRGSRSPSPAAVPSLQLSAEAMKTHRELQADAQVKLDELDVIVGLYLNPHPYDSFLQALCDGVTARRYRPVSRRGWSCFHRYHHGDNTHHRATQQNAGCLAIRRQGYAVVILQGGFSN